MISTDRPLCARRDRTEATAWLVPSRPAVLSSLPPLWVNRTACAAANSTPRAIAYYHRTLAPLAAAADGPGFCDWGVKKQLKDRIKKVLPGLQMPDFIHIVIGGIMLFTAEAVRRFSDATLLISANQC